MGRKSHLGVAVVLVLFILVNIGRHLHVEGTDLTSSYFACRLIGSGQAGHIYSRDPANFDRVGDPVWLHAAAQVGFQSAARLMHPYVQLPLWAYSLLPFCSSMGFSSFVVLFVALASLSYAGVIALVAMEWAPRLYNPAMILLTCFVLYTSEPFKYSMILTQTHIIYIFLTVAALILAKRDFYVLAGLSLALAAAVKITPAFLIIYWLVNRKFKASACFIAASLLIASLDLMLTGRDLLVLYLTNVKQLSNMLLVSWNNESLAAVWTAHKFSQSELYAWHAHDLPFIVKGTCLALSLGFTALGGWLDIGSERFRPPYGAAIAIVAATVFTPLAWTHYFVVLIIPLMLLLNAAIKHRSAQLFLLIFLITAYQIDTAAFGGFLMRYRVWPLARAEFFSGLLSILGLLIAVFLDRRGKQADRPVPSLAM